MRVQVGEQLGSCRGGVDLDEGQLPADGRADRRDLVGVGGRRRSGQAVYGALMAVVQEHALGDGGDVVLVDRRGDRVRVDAPDGVPGADLGRPLEGVGGEPVGPQERPLQAAVADQPLGVGVQDMDGVGLVGALLDDAAGEQDGVADPGRAGRRQQGLGDGLRVEEDPGHPVEQGGGLLGPELHHLGPLGQRGPLRVAGQRAYRAARGEKSVHQGAAHVSGRAGHCDHFGCLPARSIMSIPRA